MSIINKKIYMNSKEIFKILNQIFDLNPELEELISEKLKNLDEKKQKELINMLIDYTKKQNYLMKELANSLLKWKNELEEFVDKTNEESAEAILAKI